MTLMSALRLPTRNQLRSTLPGNAALVSRHPPAGPANLANQSSLHRPSHVVARMRCVGRVDQAADVGKMNRLFGASGQFARTLSRASTSKSKFVSTPGQGLKLRFLHAKKQSLFYARSSNQWVSTLLGSPHESQQRQRQFPGAAKHDF